MGGGAVAGTSPRRRRAPAWLLLLAAAAAMTVIYSDTGVSAFLHPSPLATRVRAVRAARSPRSGPPPVPLRAAAAAAAGGGSGASASASSSASSSEADLVVEVRKLRAAAIKQELQERGVSTAGIVDKEDLVTLLVRARQQQGPSTGGASSSSSSSSTAAAAGGARQQQRRRSYAAARVPFRQRTPPSTLPGGGQVAQGPKSYVCVDVTIGGERLEFLIDSGATPTIITERTRARLNLAPLGGGQRLEGVTATGSGSAPRVMLNHVCLGGDSGCVVNMDALVMGNEGVLPPGVDGLLGVRYMQYFGLVDFDFQSMTLSVYPYDARTETGSTELADLLDDASPELLARAVPMRQDPMSAIFFVDVNLGSPSSPPVPAIVDLGAGMSMVNWRAANQAGVQQSDPRVIRNQMQVWGIDGRTVPIDLFDFGEIHMAGKVRLARSRVGVADLPAFGLIGYGSRPVGVVGMDMLSGGSGGSGGSGSSGGGGGRRIVFDFRRNQLYTI